MRKSNLTVVVSIFLILFTNLTSSGTTTTQSTITKTLVPPSSYDSEYGELVEYGISLNMYTTSQGNSMEDLRFIKADENGNVVITGLAPGNKFYLYRTDRYTNGDKNYFSSGETVRTSYVMPHIEILNKTQTSAEFKLSYTKGDADITGFYFDGNKLAASDFDEDGCCTIIKRNIRPTDDLKATFNIYYSGDGLTNSQNYTCSYYLKSLDQRIDVKSTGTSLSLTGLWTKGDAEVTKQSISLKRWDGSLEKSINGNTLKATGLDPDYTYTATYVIEGPVIKSMEYSTYVTTSELDLAIPTVKQASSTSAIVISETNIDEEDTNPRVGFQWRKYDAPESLPSNEGLVSFYNGNIQGVIKNLQSTSYYKVRPFYVSNTEKYYYGEWQTFDPGDYSYIEPIVSTIKAVVSNSNEVVLEGYALQGSDDILSQGFEYWTVGVGGRAVDNLKEVLCVGNRMIATLSDLQTDTEYAWRSFVKTSSGSFYGDTQEFEIKSNSICQNESDDFEDNIVGYYNLQGIRFDFPTKGFNIVLYKSGKRNKIWF